MLDPTRKPSPLSPHPGNVGKTLSGMELSSDKFKESKGGRVKDWDSGWASWLAFKKEHGNVEIPNDRTDLLLWVEKQRESYKRFKKRQASDLSDERIKKMNDQGFKWTRESSAQRSSTKTVNPAQKRKRQSRVHSPDALQRKPSKDGQNSKKSKHQLEIAHGKLDPEANKQDVAITGARSNNVVASLNHDAQSTDCNDGELMGVSKTKISREEEKDRPVTPEMEKMSAAFLADEDVLTPLHEAHFTHQEESDAYGGADNDTESDEDWSLDGKPRAKKQTSKASPATKKASPSATDWTETSHAMAGGRYPRRSTRRCLLEEDASSESDEPDAKIQKDGGDESPDRSGAVYNVLKTSEKTGKKEVRSYALRELRRLIPEEEEEEVRQQCRVEYAHLLVPDEPVEPDKKRGVDNQTAR